MNVTLPDTDSFDTLGGELSNYAPVEDPTTDLDADADNKTRLDVAGMTETCARAWCCFVGNAATPTDPASNVHGAVWGSTAPVKPTVTRTGAGVYTITWPASVTDELSAAHTVNLRRAWWNVEGTTPYICTATPVANVVTFRVFTHAGVADDAAGVNLTVYAV